MNPETFTFATITDAQYEVYQLDNRIIAAAETLAAEDIQQVEFNVHDDSWERGIRTSQWKSELTRKELWRSAGQDSWAYVELQHLLNAANLSKLTLIQIELAHDAYVRKFIDCAYYECEV